MMLLHWKQEPAQLMRNYGQHGWSRIAALQMPRCMLFMLLAFRSHCQLWKKLARWACFTLSELQHIRQCLRQLGMQSAMKVGQWQTDRKS